MCIMIINIHVFVVLVGPAWSGRSASCNMQSAHMCVVRTGPNTLALVCEA